MRTLLFDIDGTLLMTNGGGSGAFRLALEAEFGLHRGVVNISFSGRTDRSLLPQLLSINGLPTCEQTQNRLRDRYATIFPGVLAQRGGYVLPGVPDLLARLADNQKVRIGVMTGNLHETATRKLQHFGLLRFVRWIIGGDWDYDRNELALRAAKLIEQQHGKQATDDVVVIGDTPADIRCGHAIGARVIAVCTGNHSRRELAAEDPAEVLDDLSDVDAVCDILTR
jgi:phosphoglycolate phosphatase